MGKILWLTDIHYSTSGNWDKKDVDGTLYRDKVIGNLLNKIANKHKNEGIDKIIFGGDFIGSIRNSTFRNVINMYKDISDFCMKFPKAEKIFMTGNHDVKYFDNIQQITFLFKDIPKSTVISAPGIYKEKVDNKVYYYLSYDKNIGMVERINSLNIDEDLENYMFGHFGDSVGLNFIDNDDIIEYNKIKDTLDKFEHVYLGHLHYFFEHDNITYTSSLTTQSFSDSIDAHDMLKNKQTNRFTYTIFDENMTPTYYNTNDDNYIFVNVNEDVDVEKLKNHFNLFPDKYYVLRINESVYKNVVDDLKENKNIIYISKYNSENITNGIEYIKKEVENYDEIKNVYSYFVKHGLKNFKDKDKALSVLEEALNED
jgi:hypothetical protein